MKKRLEYKLKDTTGNLRRINRQDFLDVKNSVLNQKENKTAILFVSCNSYKALKKCTEYLGTETNQNFDIIIVDNSTKSEDIELIHSLGKKKRISVVKTIENIGGSGGFSIGMEYIISQNYDNLICFEDDIIPIDKATISETIKLLSNEKIVRNEIYGTKRGGPFHLNGYQVGFLADELGVVDPRFFLKFDDIDFGHRILKLGDGNKKTTGKIAFHPLMKWNMRKPWVLCFTMRNHLFYVQKWPNTIINLARDLFIYILYGISFYLVTNQIINLYAVFYGIYSFLFHKVGVQENKHIMKKFGACLPKEPKDMEHFVGTVEECNDLLKDKYYLYGKLTGNNDPTYELLKMSNNVQDGKNNGVVMLGYLSPLFRFSIPFKKVFCLDEYIFEEKKIQISIFNNNIRLRYSKMFLSFIFSIITYIPTIILVIIKIVISIIFKKK